MKKTLKSKAISEEEEEEVDNPDKEDSHSVGCLPLYFGTEYFPWVLTSLLAHHSLMSVLSSDFYTLVDLGSSFVMIVISVRSVELFSLKWKLNDFYKHMLTFIKY